jgi:uncharacterized membrane protein YhaH (DUF805 family)
MENPYAPPTDEPPSYDIDSTSAKLTVLQILFSFEGRIPRKVYWLGLLSMVVGFFALVIMLGLLGRFLGGADVVGVLLVPAYGLFLWAHLALRIKRWHDLDKSGFWVFIALVPCIGGLWEFIETGCTRGTYGLNRYGGDPTDLY